jgi:hypothetical protein
MHAFITTLAFLVLAIQGHQAIAGTQGVTVDVGGEAVYIPAPTGFHEVSQLSPETRKFAEMVTPPKNRLLAVFVSEGDLGQIMKGEDPVLDRYILMQCYRQLENSRITGAEFSKLAGQVRQEQYTLLEKDKATRDSRIAQMSKTISKEYGIALNLKIGETAPLGVFMEKTGAIGFAYLAKCQASAEGQQLDHLVAGATSIMRVKGNLMYSHVYSKYATAQDLDWVRTTTSVLADQIQAANIGEGTSAKADYRRTGFDWNKVITYGIAGAILAGIIALLKGFAKRKKENHNA